ncbi:MAG: amidohydrolase family protein [Acidobacteria bacterium]|nr:amidohydrolase family protein [Acidobacteriota bacterium]
MNGPRSFVLTQSAVKTVIALLSLYLAIIPAGGPALGQANVTVIKGGTLIDGTGKPAMANTTIVIAGNRIQTIAQGSEAAYPVNAKVIDASGKYILPGLWDTHQHYKDWFPELLISSGVTSVLGYGGGPWLNAQKDGIEKGRILGPRMFLSQDTLGFIYMGATDILQDTEAGRKRVQQLVKAGADIVKVYTSVTPEVLRAVADEAHKAGLRVSGHIGIGAREAALAGIDNLAHSTGVDIDLVRPEVLEKVPGFRVIDTGRLRVAPPKLASWNESKLWGPNPDLIEYPLFIEDPRRQMMFGMMDQALARDLINVLVKEGVFIESCLGYVFREVHDRAKEYAAEDHLLLNDPNLSYIHPRARMNILDYSTAGKLTAAELELVRKGYKNYQWFVKTFVEAGGKLDIGVDTSSPFHATLLPGLATRREMQLLVDAGLTPVQAIQAATLWPAELLGKDQDLGTVEKGKLADLIVLRRNPLEDITAFKDIDLVMQDGRIQRTGYHYDFVNPIPWSVGDEPVFYDVGVVSEIPTRIQSISPTTVEEGSEALTLVVNGREFISSSVVQWGDRLLQTEMVDSTQLRASVPAELVRKVGTYPIRVVHRSPGWGKTNTVYLIVKFK